MTTPEFDLEKCRCPSCDSQVLCWDSGNARCTNCDAEYTLGDHILDFRLDKTFDTHLDTDAYDGLHGVQEKSSRAIWSSYERLMADAGITASGDILEIGSGSGYLSYALVYLSGYERVHCSDISPAFLSLLQRRLTGQASASALYCYLFDANKFPFRDASMDAVVGHSVLHHLAYFENTIRDACRVLRPGGVALFGDPMMEAHALTAYIAGIILDMDARGMGAKISDEGVKVLNFIRRGSVRKYPNLWADRSTLGETEDKFIFPREYLNEVAREAGFASMRVNPIRKPANYGDMLKARFMKSFERKRLDPEQLTPYDFVFEQASTTLGASLGKYLLAPFMAYAFVKSGA